MRKALTPKAGIFIIISSALVVLVIPQQSVSAALLPLEVVFDFTICILALTQRKEARDYVLVLAFLLLGIADALYCFNYVFASNSGIAFTVREALYTASISLIAIFMMHSNAVIRNHQKLDLITVAVAFLLFGFLSFHFVLMPFLKSGNYHTTFFIFNSIAYRIVEACLFSVCVVLSLKVNRKSELYFVLGVILLCVSSLALGYNVGVVDADGIPFHEYGWYYGLLLICLASLEGDINDFGRFIRAQWSSLRIRLVFAIFIPNALLFLLMFRWGILTVGNAFDVTTMMFILYALWFFSCLIAAPISRRTLHVLDVIGHGAGVAAGSVGVLELDHIIDAYNRSVRENNDLLHKITMENAAKAELACLAAIGQSTAMVAHDVRKPLAGMKALLAALPAVKDDPNQLARMAAGVDRNIATTNALLNDILEFSRDSTALDLRDHDPQSIITAALGEVLRDRSDAGVRIEYDLRHRSYLRVDDGRIVRVLANIIANAVEAMEGRGRLWFRTEERGRADLGQGRMLLAVGNSGPVIPEDARARLFDPFFTQGKKGGTGLGLAICRRIIDLHGGSIEVASGRDESTGEPSTEFTLELLAAEGRLFVNEVELIHHSNEFATFHKEDVLREEVGDTASTAEFLRLNKERGRPSYLLIVDDEPLFRETVRGLLETVPQVKDHVKVIEADSAETGLKIFEGREFDYVIADIDLGRTRMNGYEFAQRVLDQYPSAFVLIHSNKRREEMDRTIRQINSPRFMGFLPKPMKQSELLQFLACKTFEAPGVGDSEVPVRKKVLVVNDDEGLSLSFRIMLKSPGVQVLEAGSVSDALKWISGGGVDVILSDINLGEGEKDGYELLRTVREKDATIPFYLVSGYSRADEEPKAKERGANGYLQLPVDKEQLEVLMQ